MNKTNFKLFTMFLAGIAFSALTVFAATISISTNFEDGAIQYLKKLVILMDNNNTGITLDGDTLTGKNIYGDNINGNTITGSSIYGEEGMFEKYCNYGGTGCVSYEELTQGGGESLWNTGSNNKIYYSTGNVGIGTNNPNQKLVVNGTGLFSGLKVNSIAQFDNGIFSSNISGNTITTTNPYDTLNFKASEFVFKARNDSFGKIHINSSGYLGIGELNNGPLERLHVNGKVQIGTVFNLKLYSNAFYPVIESSTGRIAFKTKSGDALNIYHSGVTIGNISTLPSEKLVVDGTGLFSGIDATTGKFTNGHFGNNLKMYSDTFGYIESNNQLRFNTSGNNTRMTIDNKGNVGIGNTSPSAKLDINGGLMLGEDTCGSNDDVGKLSLIHYLGNYDKMLAICGYSGDSQNDRERIPIIFISGSGGGFFPTDPDFPEIISGVYQETFNP